MRVSFVVIVLAILIALGTAGAILAEKTEEWNLDDDGLALSGYDPVSYYQGNPRKGMANHTISFGSAVYRFSSEKNLKLFTASPRQYIPVYGGWCAWAMLDGKKVKINPTRYKIIAGRNYLFYDGFWGNTLEKWNELAEEKTEVALVKEADLKWMTLIEN